MLFPGFAVADVSVVFGRKQETRGIRGDVLLITDYHHLFVRELRCISLILRLVYAKTLDPNVLTALSSSRSIKTFLDRLLQLGPPSHMKGRDSVHPDLFAVVGSKMLPDDGSNDQDVFIMKAFVPPFSDAYLIYPTRLEVRGSSNGSRFMAL
ncbi:hypothetical protein WG66_008138 [Moniliophthora roreri]|nr:hypothetical protein WG66_008138 [Moniliophthora roreri]